MAGEPTCYGTNAHGGPAAADAEVVRRLREAGAVVIGKTNVPELTLWPFTETATFGVTRNPWDPQRAPGGSSGGSGAAVAAGLVGAALGSDGAGSIRIPAAWCGLVRPEAPPRAGLDGPPGPRLARALGQRRPGPAGRRHGALPRCGLGCGGDRRRQRVPAPAVPFAHSAATARPRGCGSPTRGRSPFGVLAKLDPASASGLRGDDRAAALARPRARGVRPRLRDATTVPAVTIRYLRGAPRRRGSR